MSKLASKSVSPKSSKEDWVVLLLNDSPSLSNAKRALKPLIASGLLKTGLTKESGLRRLLNDLVVLSAGLYLKEIWKNRNNKFSTYYGWFMAEALNSYDQPTRRVKSSILARYLEADGLTFAKQHWRLGAK